MKLTIEATVKGKEYRGTVVGFTANETTSFAIFVCGDKLIEAPIKDCKVFSLMPETVQTINGVS